MAQPIHHPSTLLKWMLTLATAATVLVALWLFYVVASVLPSRDPAHISMWQTVAFGLLLYSGLCLSYLAAGPRLDALRWSVLLLSVVAIAAGVFAMDAMIHVANTGGHFEGYLVLMGLIVSGHGVVAILDTTLTAAPPTPSREL